MCMSHSHARLRKKLSSTSILIAVGSLIEIVTFLFLWITTKQCIVMAFHVNSLPVCSSQNFFVSFCLPAGWSNFVFEHLSTSCTFVVHIWKLIECKSGLTFLFFLVGFLKGQSGCLKNQQGDHPIIQSSQCARGAVSQVRSAGGQRTDASLH